MSKNLNFWHLIPLDPQIKIFPEYGTALKWCPLLPSTIMQEIKNFTIVPGQNIQKAYFDTLSLIPRLRIFFKILLLYFIYFIDLHLCVKFRKKLWALSRYLKTD